MSWVHAAPNRLEADTLPDVRLFAVLGTWMEADVVAATVQNALTQGCERVYLVDNDSPDDTVAVATAAGAVLAHRYATTQYDEAERLRLMNAVMSDVSAVEPDDHIWWLFLDADEFPHGPHGLTLAQYVRSLDRQFRVVGTRFFDHFPAGQPAYISGCHPLDFQPLCEELAYLMCPSRHRKHPLLRWDRHGPPVEAGAGFHVVHCSEALFEPSQPAFLHHFPYRDEILTRRRLEALWAKDPAGASRALESRDTHILTRFRSLEAVYSQDWAAVQNFIALDPAYPSLESPPPASGVTLKPWSESVEPEHQHVLRWYPMTNAWRYDKVEKFHYGDDVTYRKGLAFLDGHGTIEDWGCGFAHARSFVTASAYVGVDGSSQYADRLVDLTNYTSDTDCIFMRHVLEHNPGWQRILANAVRSFRKRMVLVIFTPFSDATRVIGTSNGIMSQLIPDISFRKADLTGCFAHLDYSEESVATGTQYGAEHIFYIERN